MIDSLTIKNFKKNNYLKLTNMGKITIIGGKNNSGKTTVLESLYLLYNRELPKTILDIYFSHGVKVTFTNDTFWAPLFNCYNMENEIKINVRYDGQSESLEIKRSNDVSTKVSLKNPEVVTKRLLDFIYTKNDKKIGVAHSFIDSSTIGNGSTIKTNWEKPINNIKKISYICPRLDYNPNEIATKFGEIDISGGTSELVEALKIIEPKIKSLSSVSHGNYSLIYGDVGIGRKIPLSFMGEGTAKLFSIILAIVTTRDGIVLIDELENGIHYSLFPKLWELLVKLSSPDKFNCQIILTTHSYELLNSLKYELSDKTNNSISYIRIDDNIAVTYDNEVLLNSLDNELEVR